MTEHVEKGLQILAVAIVVSTIIFSFALLNAAGTVAGGLSQIKVAGNTGGTIQPTNTPQATPSAAPGVLKTQNAPVQGDANAKITMVEFSDFQCPFCRLFYVNSYGQIKKDYVDTGKVKVIYMNFPLDSIHPAARDSAIGAVCAHQQGKFWEYHNKLFDEQQELNPQGNTVNYGATEIKAWTAEITGIDTAVFNDCLDKKKTDAIVQAELENGVENGITGTPGFIIVGPNGQRQTISGAQPYSAFKSVFDAMLA